MMRTLKIWLAEPGTSLFGKDDEGRFTPAAERVPAHTVELFSDDDDDAMAAAGREVTAWLKKERRWDGARTTLALCTDGGLSATVHPPCSG